VPEKKKKTGGKQKGVREKGGKGLLGEKKRVCG